MMADLGTAGTDIPKDAAVYEKQCSKIQKVELVWLIGTMCSDWYLSV